MPYIATVRRVDTNQVLKTVTCPDLPSALRVKSKAFRSYHFNDLGGQVVVPLTVHFDDWDDVDRLRCGDSGPYVPVRVSIHHAADRPFPPGMDETGTATASGTGYAAIPVPSSQP